MTRFDLKEFSSRHGLDKHELHAVLQHFGDSANYWLAGGALRAFANDQPITTDLDFFFTGQEAFDAFVKQFGGTEPKANKFNTSFEIKLDKHRYKVQAVKIAYYTSPEACIDSFDFTICQLAVHQGQIYVGPYTMWDLARKRLALHKLTYGASTLRRLLKYTDQGFTACQGCLASILKAAIDNPNAVREDVQYVD